MWATVWTAGGASSDSKAWRRTGSKCGRLCPNLLLEMNVSRVSHKAGGARLGVVETASVALSKFRHC